MQSLLSPDHHWALWAVLLSTAAFGLWAERTNWGARLSGAVIAIGVTFLLSNLFIIPVSAPAYDAVWKYIVPLAIPMLLFNADLKRVFRESGPTLLAFCAGAVGTVLGTVIAFHLIPLGPEGHKLAGIFCSTYIGGSINYVAASEALNMKSGDLLTAGIAADNLVMTLYFLVLFALPSIPWLRKRYIQRRGPAGHGGGQRSAISGQLEAKDLEPGTCNLKPETSASATLLTTACAVALSAVLCAVGYGVASLVDVSGAGILVVTALAVTLATAFPRVIGRMAGAQETGTLFMMVFFAALGASANIGVVVTKGAILFVFAGLILLVHLAVILLAGRVFRLDLLEIVIASNANMGGPTTSAAMAIARRWDHLVTPAILCGTLGYAVATFIGTAVGLWLA